MAMAAIGVAGVVVDVGGFGSSMFPSEITVVGGEAIKCTHPSAAAERVQFTFRQCGCVGAAPDCDVCGGNGMVSEVFDPSDGTTATVRIDTGGLSWEQLTAEGLRVSVPQGKTEDERMATRGAWQNWLALRDATRPEGTKSS